MFLELAPGQALGHLAALGWPCAELSDEHLRTLCARVDLGQAAEEFQTAVRKADLSVPQAHLLLSADVANLNKEERSADLAAIKRQIDFCQLAGISVGVIHPACIESAGCNVASWRQAGTVRLESFRELAAYAGERGVRMAIENLFDRCGVGLGVRRRFGAELGELFDIIEAVASPGLGICLDTSHANVQGHDQPALIREMGELLIALHISDNAGSGDQHLIPLHGNIDWPPIVTALKEINFAGAFNLEIPGARRSAPGFLDLQARHALEVARALLQG